MPSSLLRRLRADGWIRHVGGYALVGALQLVVDWATYVGLSALGVSTVVANPLARAVGALFGYFGNGRYTFSDADGSSRIGGRSLVRFLMLWTVLTVVSTVLVGGVENLAGLRWAWLAKPVLDAGLAGLGFLASRYWIYR